MKKNNLEEDYCICYWNHTNYNELLEDSYTCLENSMCARKPNVYEGWTVFFILSIAAPVIGILAAILWLKKKIQSGDPDITAPRPDIEKYSNVSDNMELWVSCCSFNLLINEYLIYYFSHSKLE